MLVRRGSQCKRGGKVPHIPSGDETVAVAVVPDDKGEFDDDSGKVGSGEVTSLGCGGVDGIDGIDGTAILDTEA